MYRVIAVKCCMYAYGEKGLIKISERVESIQ